MNGLSEVNFGVDFLDYETRGQCYDHDFRRFSTIFGEKIGVFIENQCYDQDFRRFSTIFGEKIGVFIENQCYDHNFCRFSTIFGVKLAFSSRTNVIIIVSA
jgi:hypothetical protein